MGDEYVTTRERFHGVTVHQHLYICPWDEARTEVTFHVWVGSLPDSAGEVAIWFGHFPADAQVRDDDENPGSLDVRFERDTTPDELSTHCAGAEAERVRAERLAEFDRWCEEHYPKPTPAPSTPEGDER